MANYRQERKGGATHSHSSVAWNIYRHPFGVYHMCTFSDNTISIDVPVSVSPISRYTPNAPRHNRLFCGYECAPHVCVCESVPLVAYFYCYSNCIITHMTFSNSAIQKFWQISLYCYEDVRENKIKQQHQQRQQQRQQ